MSTAENANTFLRPECGKYPNCQSLGDGPNSFRLDQKDKLNSQVLGLQNF
jgi:hypothetical protein